MNSSKNPWTSSEALRSVPASHMGIHGVVRRIAQLLTANNCDL